MKKYIKSIMDSIMESIKDEVRKEIKTITTEIEDIKIELNYLMNHTNNHNNEFITDIIDFTAVDINNMVKLMEEYYQNGTPNKKFSDYQIVPGIWKHLNKMVLVNEEGKIALLNNNRLMEYHILNNSNIEGFIDNIVNEYKNGNIHEDDYIDLMDIFDLYGLHELSNEVYKMINY